MDASQKITFYKKYRWNAIYNHIVYGVPASITLAQAGIESNWGTSYLFINGKNSFGIKAYSNPDNLPVIYANDDLAHEPFRSYPSVNASFIDHSHFLLDNHRYDNLFQSNNIYEWATGLQTDEYATNPNYAVDLIDDINKYNLQKYDFLGNNKYILWFSLFALAVFILWISYKLVRKNDKP